MQINLLSKHLKSVGHGTIWIQPGDGACTRAVGQEINVQPPLVRDGRKKRIFANGFEKTREQRCANNLEFEGFRISDFDCLSPIIFTIQPFEIFLV